MDLVKEIVKEVGKDKIVGYRFEGPKVVLFTNDRDFFVKAPLIMQDIARKVKRRIHVRFNPRKLLPEKEAEPIIRELIPKEAGFQRMYFEKGRSVVNIEVLHPEYIDFNIINKIKEKTLWFPKIYRSPLIRSKIIDQIRSFMFQYSKERAELLHEIGKNISEKWTTQKIPSWVRISFLGGASQVGRSAILLQTKESRVLLDFGVDPSLPSYNKNAYPIIDLPEFDVKELDAVVVTHAHLDHIGFVPFLYRMGYKGPVYLTPPTLDIGTLSLLDYLKIFESEKPEAEKKLFTGDDIRNFVKHAITLDYEQTTDIAPDIKLTFYSAGHILGSAMAHLTIGNGVTNFLYTGDYKVKPTYLFDGAQLPKLRTNVVLTESTYGDTLHPPREQVEREFLTFIKNVIRRKGKVLIPVLGVGRAQEILYLLVKSIKSGKLDEIPIYLEGVVWEITAIHTAYPEYLKEEIRNKILKGESPFIAEFVHRASPKDREDIVYSNKPAIILATSGMLVGGPSVQYFKMMAEDEKNAIAFVSYQGANTLGRQVKEGAKEVEVDGELVRVKMEVRAFEGFSGHADRDEIKTFLSKIPRLGRIIVNHGERSKVLYLASYLHKELRLETNAPRNLDALALRQE